MMIISVFLCVALLSAFSDANDVWRFDRPDSGKIESTIVCPNNRTHCKDSQTCCQTKRGGYHCCKYENGVCCPDKYHCCPSGSTCDAQRKRCRRNDESFFKISTLFEDQMEWPVEDGAGIVCPNGKKRCKDTQTCCETKRGNYHCCKYQDAVCCPDKYHCCPSGTTCDSVHKRCSRQNDMLALVAPLLNLPKSNHVSSLNLNENINRKVGEMCPNNKTKCQDTKTCCITKRGNYYCCPHKNAVCCPDKYHCCPEGSQCDQTNNQCVNSVNVWKMHRFEKTINELSIIKPQPLTHTVSNDNNNNTYLGKKCENNPEQSCAGKKRCCTMKNGKNGCCSYNKGVCCPDLETCCPHQTECDTKNKVCTAKLIELVPIQVKVTSKESTILCPNGKVECHSWETCCQLGGDSYGCCPHENGTCCADRVTCCPYNEKCNLQKRTCDSQEQLTPIKPKVKKPKSRKSLVIFLSRIGLKNVCPDNSKCHGDMTCCELSDGRYGCCPYEEGVCCPDKETCCPSGTQCADGGCA